MRGKAIFSDRIGDIGRIVWTWAADRPWEEAAEKACYPLNLFAASIDAQDPRRQKLIGAVLDDFSRLSGEPPDAPTEKS